MTSDDDNKVLVQRARRITDIAEEPLEVLSSISGYEKKPFSSIEEAVEPIEWMLPDIQNYARLAKTKCPDLRKELTQNEAAALMLYTMGWEPSEECLYVALNATLRSKNREKLKPWLLYLRLLFSALDSLPSINDQTLYRAAKLDLSAQYPIGKTFVWWGFSSCTVSMEELQSEGFSGQGDQTTIFTIECNSAKDIQQYSYTSDESEVLILPGTQFEVIGYVQPTPDLHMIHIKESQPVESVHTPDSTSEFNVTTQFMQNPLLALADARSARNTTTRLGQTLNQIRTDPTLTMLILFDNQIDDGGVKHLADALRTNETVTSLHLTKNKLTDESAKHLADTLQYNETITILDLSVNIIGDEGLKHLADGLRNNQTITELSLSWNEIGDAGAAYLGDALRNNQTITKLELGSNHIGAEGAKHLAEVLRNSKTLIWFTLMDNQIGPQGAKYVADALRNNQTITRLDLSMNKIEVEGAKYLADALRNNQTIQYLGLSKNRIDVEGAKHLANVLQNNHSITIINLSWNEIGDEGTKYLANALQNNQTIKEISLSWNRITLQGGTYLAEMRQKNQTLAKIELEGNDGARVLSGQVQPSTISTSKTSEPGLFGRLRNAFGGK